jgi:DNA polymerase-1
MYHIYNGRDCAITLEVLHNLPPLDETTELIYQQAMDLHGPVLEMNLRGVLVDKFKIAVMKSRLQADAERIMRQLNRIITEGIGGQPINPSSPAQVQALLYNRMGITPIKARNAKGEWTASVGRKQLEKLRQNFWAEPIVNHILAYRDIIKQLGTLKTGIDRDGRIRTSFAIAGTDTGRFASYESPFGTGTNLQNITPRLREIFIADPGFKFAYIDLEQAESRVVGAIIWNLWCRGLLKIPNAPTYLDYCESHDLHTGVARMTFKHLAWTNDAKLDRAIADQNFYREFSYRDATKRLGHGTNYYGKPFQMAQETHIPKNLVEDFQNGYFSAFPEIPAWHGHVRHTLQSTSKLTSLMGRRRTFFGRRYDDDTLRAAIAYDPQGSVADIISKGILAIWRSGLRCSIMLQIHDALLVQYPETEEDEILPAIQRLMEVEVPLMNGRSLTIPTEAAVGWNWGYKSDGNPDGLIKYKGHDPRKRSKPASILDYRFD